MLAGVERKGDVQRQIAETQVQVRRVVDPDRLSTRGWALNDVYCVVFNGVLCFCGVLWWCGGVVSALDGRRQVGGVRKGATGRAGASGRGGGPARLNWGLHLEVGGVPGGSGLVFRFFRHNIDASTCQPATRVVTAHTTPCGVLFQSMGR